MFSIKKYYHPDWSMKQITIRYKNKCIFGWWTTVGSICCSVFDVGLRFILKSKISYSIGDDKRLFSLGDLEIYLMTEYR